MTVFTNNISESTASNGITFDHVVDATSGVSVTGGTAATADIYKTGSQYLEFGGNSRTLALFATDINNVGNGATFGSSTCQLSTTESDINLIRALYSNGGHGGGQNLALINVSVEANTSAQRVCLYQADSGTQQGGELYAYYSGVQTSDSSDQAYSFYAAGSAPSYFDGIIGIGSAVLSNGINNNFYTNTSGSGTRILSSQTEISKDASASGSANIHLNRIGVNTGNMIRFSENGSIIDSIRLDGSGGITYGTSDYRLKENIVDLPSATEAIKSLRPVNFNFISHPGKTRPGFIAHELQETIPAAVVGDKDGTEAIGTVADYDGTVLETEVEQPDEFEYTEEVETNGVTTQVVRTRTWTPTGTQPIYQSADQTKIIPLLTKALQEALTKIDDLEARLDAAGV